MQFVILSIDTLYEVGSLSAMWIVMMAIMTILMIMTLTIPGIAIDDEQGQ